MWVESQCEGESIKMEPHLGSMACPKDTLEEILGYLTVDGIMDLSASL